MNYLNMVEQFVEEYPNYKSDIINFNDYLEHKWKRSLEDDTIQIFIQGLDVDFIVGSLDYNVEKRKKYNKRTTAKRYAVVVGQFLDFLRKNTDIKNKELFDAVSYGRNRENAYMKRMMEYVNHSKALEGIVEVEALCKTDVGKILAWSDEQLEEEVNWNIPMNYRKAVAALGIKLILVYGLTYRELRKIKWEQYDEVYGRIRLGGYGLRLPMNLAYQIRCFRQFVRNIGRGRNDEYIFADYEGKVWGEITSSSGIPDYLGSLLGNTSITSMVKYGIRELIAVGINDTVIKKITGASDKLIAGCIEQEDEGMSNSINNKIVMVDMYYQF